MQRGRIVTLALPLTVDIALIKNNAKVGAEIAVHLSKILKAQARKR